MGVAVDGLCPPSTGLQRNQWCTFSRPAAAAFFPYKAQGKRSTSVLAPVACKCPRFQHCRFIKNLLYQLSFILQLLVCMVMYLNLIQEPKPQSCLFRNGMMFCVRKKKTIRFSLRRCRNRAKITQVKRSM